MMSHIRFRDIMAHHNVFEHEQCLSSHEHILQTLQWISMLICLAVERIWNASTTREIDIVRRHSFEVGLNETMCCYINAFMHECIDLP